MTGGIQVVQRSKDYSSSEIQWDTLYAALQTPAKHYIHTFKVPSWRGQEKDLIDEVVQETVVHILERVQRAECGEASPIYALEYMMGTVIRNCCIDMSRRDRRLVRTLSVYSLERQDMRAEGEDITEKATRNVYNEELFTLVACEVVNFPPKQQTALLTDLANLMSFDEQSTPLQKAFLAVNIDLQKYQRPLSSDIDERRKHSSLLHHAYKRVAHLASIKCYIYNVQP